MASELFNEPDVESKLNSGQKSGCEKESGRKHIYLQRVMIPRKLKNFNGLVTWVVACGIGPAERYSICTCMYIALRRFLHIEAISQQKEVRSRDSYLFIYDFT